MNELQWTKETPTEIGWYIVWTHGDLRPDFVEIANYFDEICVLTQFGDWIRDLKDWEGSNDMWYGPIPQIIEKEIDE